MIPFAGPNDDLERDVLTAFGNAIVEFEDTLFQKFILLSSRHSLTTQEMFRRCLSKMQSKGYVSPIDLHGMRAWKKMVVLDYESDTILPRRVMQVVDEKQTLSKSSEQKLSNVGVLSEAQSVAERIEQTLRKSISSDLRPGDDTTIRLIMSRYLQNLYSSLLKSRYTLFEYLRREAPTLKDTFDQLLASEDEAIVLLGLRLLKNIYQA